MGLRLSWGWGCGRGRKRGWYLGVECGWSQSLYRGDRVAIEWRSVSGLAWRHRRLGVRGEAADEAECSGNGVG